MIDGKINELRGSFGEIGDNRLVVMAALTIADELMETRDRAASDRRGAEEAGARSVKVAEQIEALGARLEALAERLAGGAEA